MKYTRQLKCAILVIHFVLFGASLYAQTFNHPGILQSEADLNYVKAKISAKQEPWLSAYTGIRNSINLNYAPQGLVTLNDQADADAYMQDGLIAFKCALIWYYSGDAAYATKAKQILNAWTIYNDPDKDQNLNVHWGAINYMSAAEIINSMGGGWSAADVAAFKVFARRLTTHMYIGWYNNAQQTQIRSRMACAIFLEDRTLFNKCLEDWRYYIDVYYYVREDGLNPPKYPYPKIHGTTWELCRDFNHANMGSKGTFEGMAIAWNQGIDLYEEQKYRMTEFLETTTGFFMGTIPIPSDICGSSFANTPGVLYCNEQGRVWPT